MEVVGGGWREWAKKGDLLLGSLLNQVGGMRCYDKVMGITTEESECAKGHQTTGVFSSSRRSVCGVSGTVWQGTDWDLKSTLDCTERVSADSRKVTGSYRGSASRRCVVIEHAGYLIESCMEQGDNT